MCSSRTKPDFSYTQDGEQGPGKVHSCPWENSSAKEQPWVKCTLEGTPWHHVDNSRMPTRQLCVRLQCSSLQTQACFHLSLTYCVCKSTRNIYPYILTAPKCTHMYKTPPHIHTCTYIQATGTWKVDSVHQMIIESNIHFVPGPLPDTESFGLVFKKSSKKTW